MFEKRIQRGRKRGSLFDELWDADGGNRSRLLGKTDKGCVRHDVEDLEANEGDGEAQSASDRNERKDVIEAKEMGTDTSNRSTDEGGSESHRCHESLDEKEIRDRLCA